MDSQPSTSQEQNRAGRIREVAAVFLLLGFIAFGGPAAHIALMEEEFVRRRHWVSREEFLDLLGITNVIPGPNSTEMALFLGQRRAGLPGLLAAGIAFILPAALLTSAIAWAYLRWGGLPETHGLLAGLQPVLLLIILQAAIGLGLTALKTRLQAGIGLLTVLGAAGGIHELILLLAAGVAGLGHRIIQKPEPDSGPTSAGIIPFISGWSSAAGTSVDVGTVSAFSTGKLFLFFLKTGSVLFGSGYVLLAFLRSDLVDRWHWLSEQQLMDAVAVGQLTPGPVFTTATFIGFILGGPIAAIAATVGIFLPAFCWVAIGGRIIEGIRRSSMARSVLDGLNTASWALLVWVALQLSIQVHWNAFSMLVLVGSVLALFRWHVASVWPMVAAGSSGWIAAGLGWN
jgi:chromate transporter